MVIKESGDNCPSCQGSGWVVEENEGREVARRCTCYYDTMLERRLASAAIPQRYREKNFDNFHPFNEILIAIKKFVTGFIKEYPAVDKGLILVGPPGTGKTHLAAAMLTKAIEKCTITGLFVDYRELIRSIQDSFNSDTEATQMSIIRPVLEADLLVMDEMGALKPTEWIQDTINYIINNRYTNDRITIFTTNYSLDKDYVEKRRMEMENEIEKELERTLTKYPGDLVREAQKKVLSKYSVLGESDYALHHKIGSRLLSRIHEMCDIVYFNGVPDYRIKKLGKRSRR